jgi:hypothetical protein
MIYLGRCRESCLMFEGGAMALMERSMLRKGKVTSSIVI